MTIKFNKDDFYLNYTNDIINHRMLWWRIMLKKDNDLDNIFELINEIKKNSQIGNYCDNEMNFNAINVLLFNTTILKNEEKTLDLLTNLVDIGYDINHITKQNSNIVGILFSIYLNENDEYPIKLLQLILDKYNIEQSIYETDFESIFFKSNLNLDVKEEKINKFFDILSNYYIVNFSKINKKNINPYIQKDYYEDLINQIAKKQLNKNLDLEEIKLKEIKKRKI